MIFRLAGSNFALVLMTIGIFLGCAGILDTWGVSFAYLKYIEIFILFAINVLAAVMLIAFGYRTLQGQPG